MKYDDTAPDCQDDGPINPELLLLGLSETSPTASLAARIILQLERATDAARRRTLYCHVCGLAEFAARGGL